MQELNATRPSDFWLKVIAANASTDGPPDTSPHAVALFTGVTAVDSFVNCSEYNETVSFGPDEYPALADMLCSLVLLGNKAHTELADSPAEAPIGGEGEAPLGGEGEGPSGEDDVTAERSAATGLFMHAYAYVYAWVVFISMAAVLASGSM